MNEFKSLSAKKKAGNKVKEVRKVIENYETHKEDVDRDVEEFFKPSIKAQEEVKKTIDKKQDELIEQLKENQQVLKEDFNNFLEANERSTIFEEELPKAIEGPSKAGTENIILDVDNFFDDEDRTILNNYNLTKPKDLTQKSPQELLIEKKDLQTSPK